LNIETQINENHQAVIKVAVPKEKLERKKRQAARKLSRNISIPGFRPGKAPYHMVARYVGEAKIVEEAIDALLDEIYPQAIEESGIEPFGPGRVETLSLEGDPKFEFLVPLTPEVQLGDYRSIRKPFELPGIDDDQVNQFIQSIRERHADREPADRPAAIGDLVEVHIVAEFVEDEDDEQADGDEKKYLDDELPFIIRDPQHDHWPFDGFTQHLIGLKKGDEKTLTYTYPPDHEIEKLQGKTVTFELAVIQVYSLNLPEMDNALAKEIAGVDTVDEMQKSIREYLELESETSYKDEYLDEIVDEILQTAEVKYPPDIVEEEIELLIERLKARLASQGLDFDTYLKTREIDEEEVKEEFRPLAEDRVKRSLVLLEIAAQEKIEVDPERVRQEVDETLQSLNARFPAEELRRYMNDDRLRGLVMNTYNNIMIENTLARLLEIATGEQEAKETAMETEETEEAEETTSEQPAEEEEAAGEKETATVADEA